MSKFVIIQAFYCIVGILFFVRDLFAHVEMGPAMIHAFIWPYAQYALIKAQALTTYAQVMSHIPH